ncbi:hypothetical protein [Bradyrhizobium sp. S3.9.1]|uniref:hypothetical protein n=1 Tax=Bradyrhizobium sp. S3.9.1 TaxID=3156431 RepID=UPI0033907F2A
MTLVISRTIGQQVFILADTRVSEHDVALPRERGVIKTTLLSPQAAISFSNSPDLASRDIRAFRQVFGGTFSYREAVDYFAGSSRDTHNDYLLNFLEPPRTVEIKAGEVSKTVGRQSWIGDLDAFKRFRAYQTEAKLGPDLWEAMTWSADLIPRIRTNPFTRLLRSFQHTLRDADILSAGDFSSVVVSAGAEFRFLYFGNFFFDQDAQGKPVQPLFGENLDFKFSVATPKISGINACAFHYPHADRGYLFYSLEPALVADQCAVYDGTDGKPFAEFCQSKTGVEFAYIEAGHTK